MLSTLFLSVRLFVVVKLMNLSIISQTRKQQKLQLSVPVVFKLHTSAPHFLIS